jgi:crossover junction endodeoxyribonuclease RuvC
MRVIGIDPGITGALAVLDGGLAMFDLPVTKGEINGYALCEELRLAEEIDHIDGVFLEETHAMPKTGSQGNYSQGFTKGAIVTAVRVAGLPLHRVAPSILLTAMGLRGKQKDASRHLASELWPQSEFKLVKHHNRAEAALIARYGLYHVLAHTQLREEKS